MVISDPNNQALFNQLPTGVAREIDEFIFNNAILKGIKAYMDNLHIGLKEALDLFQWRYDMLRVSSPAKFRNSEENYWAGFYS